MKTFFNIVALGLAVASCTSRNTTISDYPIATVDIRNVTICDSFWLPKIKTVQQKTIEYAFDKCDKEGRMENFLIAGRKKTGKTRGKFPFDDSDLYKIIEGASYSLVSSPNKTLDVYLDSIISIIKTGQEPDGYLATWFTIDPSNPVALWAKPSKKRWEHEDTNHELYNSGHLFEAAAAHYWATGKRNFLDIALKNADLLVASFGPGKLQVPPGHQIVETGLIKLFRITNNKNYLQLAKEFLDWRGDSTTHKLYGPYNQDFIPVVRQTEAVGHAVRAEYMYAGMTDIAAIYNDSAYRRAVFNIWENVVNFKTYLTGGVGARHEGESFGNNYELPNLTAYNETCAAIASVYWNQRLFLLTGDAKYIDVLERTLYNGLLAGISADGTHFFYPNPLEADGKYDFNQGSCTRQPWFDCSCCPTNLIRFIPSIPGLIYAVNKDSLFVNLFISNKSKVAVNGQNVEIVQQTAYPLSGKVNILVNPMASAHFTVKVRIPGWSRNQVMPGSLYSYQNKTSLKPVIRLNGKIVESISQKGFCEISRNWNPGDKLECDFPMEVRTVVTDEHVTDNKGKIAFELGPLVYCAEEADNGKLTDFMVSAHSDFKIDTKALVFNNINVISVDGKKKEIQLIPYYLWSNRGIGQMKLWFPMDNE